MLRLSIVFVPRGEEVLIDRGGGEQRGCLAAHAVGRVVDAESIAPAACAPDSKSMRLIFTFEATRTNW
jgi:hypothetical protein